VIKILPDLIINASSSKTEVGLMSAIFLGRKAGTTSASKVIAQQFDACASWWTQGPDSTFQVIKLL